LLARKGQELQHDEEIISDGQGHGELRAELVSMQLQLNQERSERIRIENKLKSRTGFYEQFKEQKQSLQGVGAKMAGQQDQQEKTLNTLRTSLGDEQNRCNF
jgi:hypothetical protein